MNALVLALAVLSGLAGSGPAAARRLDHHRSGRARGVRERRRRAGGDAERDRAIRCGRGPTSSRRRMPEDAASTRSRPSSTSATAAAAGSWPTAAARKPYAAAARARAARTQRAVPPPSRLHHRQRAGGERADRARSRSATSADHHRRSSAFFTRYHNCPTGTSPRCGSATSGRPTRQGRPDVTVELFSHTGTHAAALGDPHHPGDDASRAKWWCSAAHQDSIAGSNCTTSRRPGADDDASGIATITEVIRVAMALGYQPAAHGQVHGLRRGRGRPARLEPDRPATTRPRASTSSACCSST